MPNEQQLRAIASANLDEQRDVWKAQKPKKGDPQVSWWSVANSLSKKRMYARDASFGETSPRPTASHGSRITDRIVAELEKGVRPLDAALAFRQWQRKRDTAAAA